MRARRYASPTSSSWSVIASIANCAASSDPSSTSTFCGTSSVERGWCSTAVSSSEVMPAAWRIAWISSASVDILCERNLDESASSGRLLRNRLFWCWSAVLDRGWISSMRSAPALDQARAAPLIETGHR